MKTGSNNLEWWKYLSCSFPCTEVGAKLGRTETSVSLDWYQFFSRLFYLAFSISIIQVFHGRYLRIQGWSTTAWNFKVGNENSYASFRWYMAIGGFHVTRSPPCWWTKAKDFSLASFVRPPEVVLFFIVLAVSRGWLKTTYWRSYKQAIYVLSSR